MNVMVKNEGYNAYHKENTVKHEENKLSYEENKKNVLKTNVERIKEALEKSPFKTEEEKESYERKLNEKIKLGEKLTQREMDYLQRTNPMLYMRVKRVQMQREMLESRLKQCRSKKEVEEVYSQAMSMVHKKDPDKQLVMSAYNNVTKEFKKTKDYKELPEDIEDKKKVQELKVKKQRKEISARVFGIENETNCYFNLKC